MTTVVDPSLPPASGERDALEESRAYVRTVLARTEGDADAREREVRFHHLIAQLATDFVGLAGTELDGALGRTLERIATFTGAERALLVRLVAPDDTLHVTHEWAGDGPDSLLHSLHGRKALHWSIAQLRQGTILRVHDRSELPPDAIQEARVWESFGLRSVLALPVRARDGGLLGFAAFATTSRRAAWRDEELPLFDLASEMLRSAFEQQRARRNLEHSELRLRKLLDSGAIGIVAADGEGRIWQANDVALAVMGASADDLVTGRLRWDRLTPPEYRPMTMGALEQLERSGSSEPWEQDMYRVDGSRATILLCLARVAETPGHFLIYAVDVTADKRVERVLALRNRLSRLVTLFSTRLIAVAPSCIGETIEEALREIGGVLGIDRCTVWIDIEGKGTLSRCAHVWDRDHSAGPPARLPAVDRALFPIWDAHFRERRAMLVRDVFAEFEEERPERVFLTANRIRSGVAVPLVGGTGPIGFATFAANRVVDWPEATVSLLCVIGEIFAAAIVRGRIEEKRQRVQAELERSIAERTAQLESANRELEAFSYAVSHDLRAPLRSVDGFSRILVEDYSDSLPEDARIVLDRVRATSQRMGELIDSLLRLSRITRCEPQFEETDLSAIAREIAVSLAATEPQRVVDFQIEDGLIVDGEPRLLRAMMENLLGNAWKFTAPKSHAHVEVGAERDEAGRVYFVNDDGVGFEASQSGRIFTPFQRLHHPRDFEGHGVGLATVKRIVVLHRGRVWAEGRPDKGATIRFTLAGRA